MAKAKLELASVDSLRVQLTQRQEKEIRSLYQKEADRIAKEAEKLPKTISGALRKQYLSKLQEQLNTEIENLNQRISETIEENMETITTSMVDSNKEFLEGVSFPVEGAFSKVPSDVIESIVSGKLYGGKWSLSKAIWNTTAKTQKDISKVVAVGIAANKSAYDIAKDLEKYVSPSAKKDWEWSKVYPGTNKKVDYNAQRLARTMVSHAYQQSLLRTTQKNPFVEGYRWLISNSHGRTCELCKERAEQNQYGLGAGVFPKDKLPLDHPNGMCTQEVVFTSSMEDIASRIASWAKGGSDPELENFAKFIKS